MGKNNLIAYAFIVIFMLFWGAILAIKYYSFGYQDWDLAFFNQSQWGLLHGSSFSSLFNHNFFGNHANLIAFLFLPFYGLFPQALFLIYLKAAFFSLAGLPIFLIAKKNLSSGWGVFFTIIYFLYPPLSHALIYEFDWESLAVFFIPWIFYLYQNKKFAVFCLASFVLLTIKENMPLYIFMLGFYSLFTHRPKKWFLFPVIASIAWFYLSVFIFIPHFSAAKQHLYWGHYSIFSKGLIEVIKFLFTPLNKDFVFQLFSPLMFLSFLRPDVLLLGAPFFLQHMLSVQPSEHTVYFNYSFSLAPFIFISAIFAIKLMFKKSAVLRGLRILAAGCIIAATLIPAKAFWLYFGKSVFAGKADSANASRRELLGKIPEDSSVLASFVFLPRLSSRKYLFALHDIYAKIHYKDFREIKNPEYALIDFNDPYMVYFLKQSADRYKDISVFFENTDFGVLSAVNDNVLFKRGYASDFKLFEKKEYAPEDFQKSVLIDNSIRLAFSSLSGTSLKNKLNRFRLRWHCLKEVKENYEVRFILVDYKLNAPYNISHPICYRIRPTSQWRENESFEEDYNFLIPDLAQGKYFLMALFFDEASGKTAQLSSEWAGLSNNNTIANLGMIDITSEKPGG